MTEGYEGFYHLTDMKGDCSAATLSYIVRDHSKEKFEERLETLKRIEKQFKEKYGEDSVNLKIKLQYENMKQKIEPVMHLIENAKEGARRAGVTPATYPIRGGTDGARLSFMGLPCPNLGTGGHAYHGPYEHVTVEGMEKSSSMVLEIIKLYGKMKRGQK
jgi:tripeptide aminopeptidase